MIDSVKKGLEEQVEAISYAIDFIKSFDSLVENDINCDKAIYWLEFQLKNIQNQIETEGNNSCH